VAGKISCWGCNALIQGAPDVQVAGITIGDSHACALLEDGSVECWGGENKYGQRSPPNGETFVEISARLDRTCGRRADGSARCWGYNDEHDTQADL
jgi:hypothetical protein